MKTLAAMALALAMPGMASAADDPSIQAFEEGQQAAWNAGDGAAYTAAFAPDADIVTASGWHWTGGAQAKTMLTDGFKLVYAKSRLALAVSTVRPLSPGLVAVSLDWSLSGARTLDGAAPLGAQRGIEIQILRRDGNRWTVLSQQDTVLAAVPAAIASGQAAPGQAAATPAPPAFPTTPPPARRCVLARATGACLIYGKPKPAGG